MKKNGGNHKCQGCGVLLVVVVMLFISSRIDAYSAFIQSPTSSTGTTWGISSVPTNAPTSSTPSAVPTSNHEGKSKESSSNHHRHRRKKQKRSHHQQQTRLHRNKSGKKRTSKSNKEKVAEKESSIDSMVATTASSSSKKPKKKRNKASKVQVDRNNQKEEKNNRETKSNKKKKSKQEQKRSTKPSFGIETKTKSNKLAKKKQKGKVQPPFISGDALLPPDRFISLPDEKKKSKKKGKASKKRQKKKVHPPVEINVNVNSPVYVSTTIVEAENIVATKNEEDSIQSRVVEFDNDSIDNTKTIAHASSAGQIIERPDVVSFNSASMDVVEKRTKKRRKKRSKANTDVGCNELAEEKSVDDDNDDSKKPFFDVSNGPGLTEDLNIMPRSHGADNSVQQQERTDPRDDGGAKPVARSASLGTSLQVSIENVDLIDGDEDTTETRENPVVIDRSGNGSMEESSETVSYVDGGEAKEYDIVEKANGANDAENDGLLEQQPDIQSATPSDETGMSPLSMKVEVHSDLTIPFADGESETEEVVRKSIGENEEEQESSDKVLSSTIDGMTPSYLRTKVSPSGSSDEDQSEVAGKVIAVDDNSVVSDLVEAACEENEGGETTGMVLREESLVQEPIQSEHSGSSPAFDPNLDDNTTEPRKVIESIDSSELSETGNRAMDEYEPDILENGRFTSDVISTEPVEVEESSELSETDDKTIEEYEPGLLENPATGDVLFTGGKEQPEDSLRTTQDAEVSKPSSEWTERISLGTREPKQSDADAEENIVVEEAEDDDPYLEKDVVQFIGNFLQEDVQSWLNETTEDGESGEDTGKVQYGTLGDETVAGSRGGFQQPTNEEEGEGSKNKAEEDSEFATHNDTVNEEDAGNDQDLTNDISDQVIAAVAPEEPLDSATAHSASDGKENIETNLSIERTEDVNQTSFPSGTGKTNSEVGSEAVVNLVPWDRKSMESSEDKDTDAIVSVVTWNLAEESPTEEDAAFISRFRELGITCDKGSDLVLIAGQECENIKPRRAEGRRSREYRRLMIKMLGKGYLPIALHLCGGLQFGLFARKSFMKDIEEVSVTDVTCGIGNVFHNKGAIAAFVKLKARNPARDTKEAPARAKSLKLMFLSAHLAAHVKNADARDSDFWRISTEMEAQAPEGFLPRRSSIAADDSANASFLFDSMDRVFFCGDLNYRLDLPRETTEHVILHDGIGDDSAATSALMCHDQLVKSMTLNRAFPGFAEGKIEFAPTFKFDKETRDYDTSHKQRIPAFTDRVLFKPTGTRVIEYASVPGARHSDHRPVHATFRVNMEGEEIASPNSKRRKN